jgi:hypothetical protein
MITIEPAFGGGGVLRVRTYNGDEAKPVGEVYVAGERATRELEDTIVAAAFGADFVIRDGSGCSIVRGKGER